MADLIAIGYPDTTTALQAEEEVQRLAKDLVIQPDAVAAIIRNEKGHIKTMDALSKYGGTVLKTSLSKEAEKHLQEALHGEQPS